MFFLPADLVIFSHHKCANFTKCILHVIISCDIYISCGVILSQKHILNTQFLWMQLLLRKWLFVNFSKFVWISIKFHTWTNIWSATLYQISVLRITFWVRWLISLNTHNPQVSIRTGASLIIKYKTNYTIKPLHKKSTSDLDA